MKPTFLLLFSLIFSFLMAQNAFITVNGETISKEKFYQEYKNNIDAEGLDKAIETYVDFTLIKQDALKKKIDTTTAYEISKFNLEQILLKEYHTRPDLRDSLLQEIWRRMQTERLTEKYTFPIQNNWDKTAVENQRKEVENQKNLLCKPENQSQREEFNQEKNTVASYISPFILNFQDEELIFRTESGKCSDIQQDAHEFTFYRVIEERPFRGIYHLSQILNKDEKKIKEAYQKLQNGLAFTEAVLMFSEDLSSKNNLGRLPEMTSNIPDSFYEAVKNLNSKELTQPFQTDKGWHILLLHQKLLCENYKSCKSWLNDKLTDNLFNQILMPMRNAEAEKYVKIEEKTENLNQVLKLIQPENLKNGTAINFERNLPVWQANEFIFSQQDLLNGINAVLLAKNYQGDLESLKNTLVEELKSFWRFNVYMGNMEKFNPEMKADFQQVSQAPLVHFYHENYINYQPEKDKKALAKYLEKNAEKFTWPKRFDIQLFTCLEKETQKEIENELKKGKNSDDILNKYKGKLGPNNQIPVHLFKGKFVENSPDLPKKVTYEIGIFTFEENNKFYVAIVINTIEPQKMTVEEAGSGLIDSFNNQQYLKNIQQLRKNAKIEINK